MSADSFTSVAPYYDELMRPVPYRMWVGYYLLLLSHQNQKPKRVLDVCCGTGTMCEMLTAEEMTLTGIDISPEMIREAKKKAARKKLDIDYFVADATKFDLGRRFDAAFSFFDSLNNILDPARLQGCFKSVSDHLNPGGSIIFDMNTSYAFETQLFDQENLKVGKALRYQWKGDWDRESRIITVTMNFWKGDQEFTEIHRQRAYEQEEIFDMLGRAGFRDLRAFHSYSLNPPRHKSDRIHFCATRA